MPGTMTFGLPSKIAVFGWPKRLAVYAFLYAIYLLLTVLVGPKVVQFVDSNYPGKFFYHLEVDENPGPLGTDSLLFSITIDYFLFAVLFIPIAIKARMPAYLIFILAVLNEPIIFICLVGWFTLFSIR